MGPSSSSAESSRVSDSYGTCDELDYDDDQSSSLELESDLKTLFTQLGRPVTVQFLSSLLQASLTLGS